MQDAKAGEPAGSAAGRGGAPSPRLDIAASAVSSQPVASAPPQAADVSTEVDKLQVGFTQALLTITYIFNRRLF